MQQETNLQFGAPEVTMKLTVTRVREFMGRLDFDDQRSIDDHVHSLEPYSLPLEVDNDRDLTLDLVSFLDEDPGQCLNVDRLQKAKVELVVDAIKGSDD